MVNVLMRAHDPGDELFRRKVGADLESGSTVIMFLLFYPGPLAKQRENRIAIVASIQSGLTQFRLFLRACFIPRAINAQAGGDNPCLANAMVENHHTAVEADVA